MIPPTDKEIERRNMDSTVKTQKSVSLLSNEELRVKVAELCGWTKDDHYEAGFADPSKNTRLVTGWRRSDGIFFRKLPDYCHDLNACHEFEQAWHEDDPLKWNAFVIELRRICDAETFDAYHATARQRCEAFVLTMANKIL